jgi:toxin ParE1/3/4
VPLKVRRLPLAIQDLDEIWMTIAMDSPRAADNLARRFFDAEDRLADFPELGEARPDIAPGLRKWTVGNYLIFYRVDPDAVTIVRVVHGARDLPAALA